MALGLYITGMDISHKHAFKKTSVYRLVCIEVIWLQTDLDTSGRPGPDTKGTKRVSESSAAAQC